jgi:hypothetical protein
VADIMDGRRGGLSLGGVAIRYARGTVLDDAYERMDHDDIQFRFHIDVSELSATVYRIAVVIRLVDGGCDEYDDGGHDDIDIDIDIDAQRRGLCGIRPIRDIAIGGDHRR